MGRKSLPEGTLPITFNVQKEVFNYLTYLIKTSSIGGDEEEVAQHIFRDAMREAEETGNYEIKRRAEREADKS